VEGSRVSFDIYSVPRSPSGRRQFRATDKIELLEEAESCGVRGIGEVAALPFTNACSALSKSCRWTGISRLQQLHLPVVPFALA